MQSEDRLGFLRVLAFSFCWGRFFPVYRGNPFLSSLIFFSKTSYSYTEISNRYQSLKIEKIERIIELGQPI